jgi:hypothetical protein
MQIGSDPQHLLGMVLQRQEEVRARARQEAEVRGASRAVRGHGPATFKLWRLHVMVWLDGARETP